MLLTPNTRSPRLIILLILVVTIWIAFALSTRAQDEERRIYGNSLSNADAPIIAWYADTEFLAGKIESVVESINPEIIEKLHTIDVKFVIVAAFPDAIKDGELYRPAFPFLTDNLFGELERVRAPSPADTNSHCTTIRGKSANGDSIIVSIAAASEEEVWELTTTRRLAEFVDFLTSIQ